MVTLQFHEIRLNVRNANTFLLHTQRCEKESISNMNKVFKILRINSRIVWNKLQNISTKLLITSQTQFLLSSICLILNISTAMPMEERAKIRILKMEKVRIGFLGNKKRRQIRKKRRLITKKIKRMTTKMIKRLITGGMRRIHIKKLNMRRNLMRRKFPKTKKLITTRSLRQQPKRNQRR